jgi:hypothetical protein
VADEDYCLLMPHLVLGKILDGAPGVKRDGSAYLISEDLECTAFIALGAEVLQVARVIKVEIATEMVTLVSQKGERFFFPPEQVVGWRVGGEGKAAKLSAGFSK